MGSLDLEHAEVLQLRAALPAKPTLTMEQEFARDMSWKDWGGHEYALRAEWA